MADSEPLETEAEIDPDLRTSSGQATDLPTCDDRPPASLPDRIGRYRIEKVLGQGGFGLVYLAHDDKLDRPVAIKVPHARLVSRPKDAQAYLTEARTVANLEHPNIVPVYDVGSTEEFAYYVVSRYVEGSDLSAKIQQQGLSTTKAVELIATVAEALHYAHTRGLVHRDIKPANILLDAAGKPFVADFGLALKEKDIGKGPGYAGTPAYMSPEQARGEGHRVDGRSDIFSLGIMFYQLLVGKRPFNANSKPELLQLITTLEARPPRQVNDRIPRELERICLKALAKRASDRYTTARDLAEDLRHFLSTATPQTTAAISAQGAPLPITPAGETQVVSDTPAATPVSDSPPIRIVPKGLRSFDEHDADFFLELLPGARDRDGLPESLRFWKHRIEEMDADKTFSVGLIIGPSGCGKSSLVKAGLLPRLSDDIISVYVEATPEETETRLLYGLRKGCPALDDNLNLKETLAALRRGKGVPDDRKVLIVLDQFEQWLHAKKEEQNTELVQALRQCDGGQVQCIVMVREDFWLAVTRFSKDLEIRFIEGQNHALVDLFDLDHAETTLAAFGSAFGRLKESEHGKTRKQSEFLKQSVAGLAEDGKVICVRLALFAEMMKGKPWTPAALKEVGGTEGIGANFLEETFSASTAPPEHRLHQKDARVILKALLPESGSNIKGQMRTYDELLVTSGYAQRPKDFDELIGILDSEIRLITPTDPEGVEPDGDSGRPTEFGKKYYQLTHDYLVPSLREWLTRKQRQTRRGRAELKLAERSALWNAQPENRHVPAWWEYGNIRLLTDKKNWTGPQQKMMARAARIHGVRWGSALLLTLIVGVTIQQMVSAGRHQNLSEQIVITVSSLNTSRGIILPTLTDLNEFPREMVLAELREQFESADNARKLPLAYALAHFGDVRAKFLVSQVEDASSDEVDNFVAALDRSRTEAVTELENVASTAESEKNWRHNARLAMLALWLKSPMLAQETCRLRPDPIQRTWFIEECSTWHGNLSKLAQLVAESDDSALRSGLVLAVGSVPIADALPAEKQEWKPVLANWYATAPDTPTHSSAGWALRKWNLSVPEIERSKSPSDGMNWHVNNLGMTMLKIPGGSFMRKDDSSGGDGNDQTVTLSRSFLVAAREVSRAQFQQFIDDPDSDKPTDWEGAATEWSPSERHPVQLVNWYDAVMFCNWLSGTAGLTPCYERTGEKDKDDQDKPTNDDAWRLVPEANGYRLPTEAEWEYACRAGTATTFSHGDDESQLDRYAVIRVSRMEVPGSKLPNGWGLFDVHGNVNEWCQDWYESFGSEAAVSDPLGPSEGRGRVLRGGSFGDNAQDVRSMIRYGNRPDYRLSYYGFRVARTYR